MVGRDWKILQFTRAPQFKGYHQMCRRMVWNEYGNVVVLKCWACKVSG